MVNQYDIIDKIYIKLYNNKNMRLEYKNDYKPHSF